jgi:hypothetical protein
MTGNVRNITLETKKNYNPDSWCQWKGTLLQCFAVVLITSSALSCSITYDSVRIEKILLNTNIYWPESA